MTKTEILNKIRSIKANPDSYDESVVRADPYSMVATEMLRKVPDSTIFEGMSFSEVRAYCEYPLMTALYNSRQVPIEAFGDDTPELEAFYTVLEELFDGAVAFMEAINESWDDQALSHHWKTPDGHVAFVPVMETVTGTIEAGGMEFGYTYHSNEASTSHTSLAPNLVHSLDGYVVRNVVESAPFNVIHVHDELKCHPNNCGDMIDLYREAFIDLIDAKPFEKFLGRDLGIDYSEVREGIKEATYLLC
jgi:hypothetical protein